MACLRARGRGAFADAYLGMLEKLAEHRGLENGKGLHAYISYQCTEKEEPDVKSDISPRIITQSAICCSPKWSCWGNLMTGQFQILVDPIIIFESDEYVYYLNDD